MAEAYGREAHFLSIDELANMPKAEWLIEDLFETNSLTELAGPSGHYKSFVTLDWMLCIASGRDWNDKKVKKQKVLYLLGEGKSGLYPRIEGWTAYHRPSKEELEGIRQNFRVGFEMPHMGVGEEVTKLLDNLAAEGFDPEVVVIDTLARSSGGLDENTQKDMNMWIANCERLRSLGKTVLFVHHCGRNTEGGYRPRGSSVVDAAVDTGMMMHKSGKDEVTLACFKQKDHEAFKERRFHVHSIQLLERTTAVLVPKPDGDEANPTQSRPLTELVIDRLLKDGRFQNDSSRAAELAALQGISHGNAKKRISERRKELGDLKVAEMQGVTVVTDDEKFRNEVNYW